MKKWVNMSQEFINQHTVEHKGKQICKYFLEGRCIKVILHGVWGLLLWGEGGEKMFSEASADAEKTWVLKLSVLICSVLSVHRQMPAGVLVGKYPLLLHILNYNKCY